MSMRVEVSDDGAGISVAVVAGSGYSPDVMKDLKARAVEAYSEAAAMHAAIKATTEDGDA